MGELMNTQQAISWLALALRWTARVTGLLLVGLVLVFMFGYGGPPNVFTQSVPVQLEFLATAMMLAGFVLGWWREAAGGGLALIGFALFFGVEMVENGSPPGGAIPLFCVPGVLLLISSVVGRAVRRGPKS
jgi:hypothetical protein